LRPGPADVGEVVEPVQVGPGGEVIQHVDPAEFAHRQLDESGALGRVAEKARLHLVPVLERLDGGERQADLGVQSADDQPPPPGSLHGLPEGLVFERVHRRPVDRLDAVKLGHDRRQSRSVEAEFRTCGSTTLAGVSDRMTSNVSFW
jgi:hypothetical protein